MASTIEIIVNGDPKSVETGTTLTGLIESLGLQTAHVAVERNREIVPRAEHAATSLAAGDTLEIVTFVGGG
ncbi:MAG: sulfur carrier protein ThiS [Myxococcota bacterium]